MHYSPRLFVVILMTFLAGLTMAPASAAGTRRAHMGFRGTSSAKSMLGTLRSEMGHSLRRAARLDSLVHRTVPLGISAVRQGQDASTLAVPDSDFAPATVSNEGRIDSTNLSASPFTAVHSSTGYNGLVGAYGMIAAESTIHFFYQGTVFGTAAESQASYQDAAHTLAPTSSTSTTDCTTTFSEPCVIIVYPTTSGNVDEYTAIQINQCLVETGANAPSDTSTADATAATDVVAKVTVDAVHHAVAACTSASASGTPSPTPVVTPSPTPAVPSIGIKGVAIIYVSHGKSHATRVLHLKENALFVVIYAAANAGTSTPSARLNIKKGSRTVAGAAMTAATLTDGTTYFEVVGKFTRKSELGHLVAHFTVKIGSSTASKKEGFTLKKTLKP